MEIERAAWVPLSMPSRRSRFTRRVRAAPLPLKSAAVLAAAAAVWAARRSRQKRQERIQYGSYYKLCALATARQLTADERTQKRALHRQLTEPPGQNKLENKLKLIEEYVVQLTRLKPVEAKKKRLWAMQSERITRIEDWMNRTAPACYTDEKYETDQLAFKKFRADLHDEIKKHPEWQQIEDLLSKLRVKLTDCISPSELKRGEEIVCKQE
jgi:uncharacterized protein YeaO (DUF488 family)